MTTPACASPDPLPGESDDAFLQRLLIGDRPHIRYRAAPYRLTRTLRIPAGVTVVIDPRTRLVWTGEPGSVETCVGLFEADGDDVGVVVTGGEAFVECTMASPFVYAVLMRGRRGLTVTNIQARECGHVYVAAATDDYARIQLDGPGANAARQVRVVGGGASYARIQASGHGACMLSFAHGCDVRGARYRNVANAVQWWGGNADPVRPPAQGGVANERKCRDILIENVTAEHIGGAGIWGSMGSDVMVRGCTVAEVNDVGFDAEGSNRVTFERCTSRNARNGCFSTFFLCSGVRFIDCTGIVDDKAFPLFRVYNESQTNAGNTGLEIVGGTFECRDRSGAGTIDTAMGPVGTLSIIGATLTNVRIDVAFSNMHRTVIARNTLDLPRPLAGQTAIRAGASKSLQGAATPIPGGVVIENNIIRYSAVSPAGTATAIQVREDDYNSSAIDRIRANRVSGPFTTGIAVINASLNSGVVPRIIATGNRFDQLAPTARLLDIRREGDAARQPEVEWSGQIRDGKPVPLARASGSGPASRVLE